MRKISLDPYNIVVEEKEVPFLVKESIYNALYHPDLRLSAKDLLDNDRLAQKIKACGNVALLEEEEYQRVLQAFNTIKGFGSNDVELVRRVLEASEVEVKEA
jgi:hypothetical protein